MADLMGVDDPRWMLNYLQAQRLARIKRAGAPQVALPAIDYILWLGSSTPAETSLLNAVLGRQEQALRASFCAAGIDVPVISRAVGGRTIGTALSALASDIAYMGNAVANGKKVGVLVNIGSNNIGLTSYSSMPQATRDTMLDNLNSIIDQVLAAGMIPILSTVHSRSTAGAIFEEWADLMYRPLIMSRLPDWYAGPLAAFDYCRLYTTNDGIADWYQPDGLHPNVATGYYQSYTAAQLKAFASCPAVSTEEKYVFAWGAGVEYIGGINQLAGAASGIFPAGTVRNVKAAINANASLSWSGATGASGGSRGNSGIWDVGLTNHRIQSGSLYKSAGTISFAASFGAGYASRSGVIRFTGNSSTAGRLTNVTVGANSAVMNVSTGIALIELPFTLDGSGNLTFTAAPFAPSTFANVSGVELVFA